MPRQSTYSIAVLAGLLLLASLDAVARPNGPRMRVRKDRQLYKLSPASSYMRRLEGVNRTLQKEIRNGNGRTAGVVKLKQSVPTVVISDLHGRKNYLRAVLRQKDPATGKSYMSLMRKGRVQVVLVGDAMHGEARAAGRGAAAERDADRGVVGKELQREVAESMNTMRLIMALKARYPKSFHYLKGNHDNILNRSSGGDHAFYKYADRYGEGALVKSFVQNRFGNGMLQKWAQFEALSPLLAQGSGFLVSHSGPAKAMDRSVVDQRTGTAVKNFTWTDLTKHSWKQARAVKKQLQYFGMPDGVYLAGHRQTGDKKFRTQGKFHQFNSETNWYYAVMRPGQKFDPQRDIKDAKAR